MNDNFEEPKVSKFKLMSSIVSPIPKKVPSTSNNDNLQHKPGTMQKPEPPPIDDSSNIHKFVFHKNSAFRYFFPAKGSSILPRNFMDVRLIEARIVKPLN